MREIFMYGSVRGSSRKARNLLYLPALAFLAAASKIMKKLIKWK